MRRKNPIMSGDAHTTAPSPTSTTSYAVADPSPASLQGESTLLSFLESLSPMKSDKRARYVQRFSMSSFPISQPVFDSPRSSPTRYVCGIDSDEIRGSGGDQSKGEGGDDVQEASIGSACVDQYLADPLPMRDGESSVAMTSDAYALADESAEPVSGVDCQQSEHGQHQRDIRRYLQFETVQAGENSSDVTHDMTNLSQIPAHDEPQGLSSIQDENCGQNLISRSYYFPSSTFTTPRSTNLLTTSSRHSAGNPIAQEEEKMVPEGIKTLLLNDLHTNISIPSAVGAFHALLDSGLSVSRDTSIPGPANLAVDILQHSSSLQFTQLNIQLAPSQTPHPSQSFGGVEALNRMTPERIRKRSRNNNDTKGCKHCNCKRSRCLKLYCECFSAGLYCDDDCSCENCLNKADYEDTVNDVRKQIELRNPHAFAAKVVEHVTGSPANTMEEFNQTTPSSARHKRGCNCKKSKCVKKYCECYQAYVGCSEGCRCENCENPFGTKAEVMHRRTVNQENQYPEQLDVLKTQSQCARIGRSNQSSPIWEPLSDISNLAPLSHPSLAGHRSRQFAPTRFTPKFDGSLPVENFTSMLHNVVYAPPVLDHAFTPRKTSKAGSSNERLTLD